MRDLEHGTEHAYKHWHCRCDRCCVAGSEMNKRSRRERTERIVTGLTTVSHGTASGYRDGCRCDDCRVAGTAARMANYAARPVQHRENNLRRYGLTLESYAALLDEQCGVCASCRLPESAGNQYGPRSLAVDHCHDTGRVRGLLYTNCNSALGLLGDKPGKVRMLLQYIERP